MVKVEHVNRPLFSTVINPFEANVTVDELLQTDPDPVTRAVR
jgi:hypothetical protein